MGGAGLTLLEVTEVREQNVCVVGRGQARHVVLAHLAQRLPVHRLEEHHVHLLQDVLLDGPVQPLPDVVLGPNLGVWSRGEEGGGIEERIFFNRSVTLG